MKRDDWWQWHQLNNMQTICTLFQIDNHAGTTSVNFLRARCSSCHQTDSVKSSQVIIMKCCHLILSGRLIGIHDARIIQHHVVVGQRQYAVVQSCYDFLVSRRHRLYTSSTLCQTWTMQFRTSKLQDNASIHTISLISV